MVIGLSTVQIEEQKGNERHVPKSEKEMAWL